ncbi:MAG: DUF998 domain-containing protein [Dehalococcoidia bacterium]|nr:DUF998 domain-containing protein [Dehalococcoidia bacterium]
MQIKRLIFASYIGQAGIFILLLSVLIAATSYVGKQNETYSFLNHFISELGEKGVSQFAYIFNGGLILGGAFISFFMLGLAMHIGNSWGLILGAIGLVTGVSAALVGVFPMNQLEIHTAIANTFFYGGLLVALGYTLYVLFSPKPRLPKITALTGGLTMLAFAAFVWFLPAPLEDGQNIHEILKNRPKVWMLPILEWVVFLCVMVWIGSTASLMRMTIKNDK